MASKKPRNDCIYLEQLLPKCNGPFAPDMCAYMDNSETCCWYANTKPVVRKHEADKTESVLEFHERIKQELADMGINYAGFDNEPDPVMPEDF